MRRVFSSLKMANFPDGPTMTWSGRVKMASAHLRHCLPLWRLCSPLRSRTLCGRACRLRQRRSRRILWGPMMPKVGRMCSATNAIHVATIAHCASNCHNFKEESVSIRTTLLPNSEMAAVLSSGEMVMPRLNLAAVPVPSAALRCQSHIIPQALSPSPS